MPIYFYTTTDEYGCFSNFSPYGVLMNGDYYPTVEHYFQAMKFADEQYRVKILRTSSPKEAKRLGWTRDIPIRPDWDEVKDEIMFQAVLCKFKTHQAIRETLLSTDDEELIENAPGDYYWGCGADGTGQNKLGYILMQVRTLLRDEQTKSL